MTPPTDSIVGNILTGFFISDIYQNNYTQKERKSCFFLFLNIATPSIKGFCVLYLPNLSERVKVQQPHIKITQGACKLTQSEQVVYF